MIRFFSLLLAVVVAADQLYAQSNRQYTRAYRDSVLQSHVGTRYPTYDLLLNNGKGVSDIKDKGKVVFINIWFGGCIACYSEFKALNELYDSLKNDPRFEFISIAMEPRERIAELAKKYDLHYPIASADNTTCSRLNYSSGYPANLIIDKTNKISVLKVEGYSELRAKKVFMEEFLSRMRVLAKD